MAFSGWQRAMASTTASISTRTMHTLTVGDFFSAEHRLWSASHDMDETGIRCVSNSLSILFFFSSIFMALNSTKACSQARISNTERVARNTQYPTLETGGGLDSGCRQERNTF